MAIQKNAAACAPAKAPSGVLSADFLKKYVSGTQMQLRIAAFLRRPENAEALGELRLLAESWRDERNPDVRKLYNAGIVRFFANLRAQINNCRPLSSRELGSLLDEGILR